MIKYRNTCKPILKNKVVLKQVKFPTIKWQIETLVHARRCGENFNNRYGVYEGLLFNNNPFAAGGATVKRCGVFL